MERKARRESPVSSSLITSSSSSGPAFKPTPTPSQEEGEEEGSFVKRNEGGMEEEPGERWKNIRRACAESRQKTKI